MSALSLTNKVFLGLSSFEILYQAQTQLAMQEMNTVLENQTLSLSTLASARPDGKFDFEMSTYFFSQFQRLKPRGFFRFTDSRGTKTLRENPGAPALNCMPDHANRNVTLPIQGEYRVKATEFRPEVDSEISDAPHFVPPWICLIVGIETRPYRGLVCMVALLLFLVRRLTGDISRLTTALAVADFGLTHEFPVLPEAQTLEVKAVVEKLAGLHEQATDVYRLMWFFLGRAAHQIKTPVAAMQATLQVLLRTVRTKEELLSGLADVESAASLLAELTKKLISSSRISYLETPAPGWIDFQEFFVEQLKLFRSKSEQQGVISLLFPSPALRLFCISYLIADQGPGFPEQVKRTLFEPFVRGDERLAPGSGLGLSIANRAAQLLGGSVALTQSHGKGSLLAVSLPIEGKRL